MPLTISIADVYETAVKWLARREYTADELSQKLHLKGFEQELIDATLICLQKENLQSDVRYIEMLIRTRQHQGYGPVKVGCELQKKGVDAILLEEYFNADDQSWYDLVVEVYTKKFGDQRASDFQTKAKQMRFLQYRGFTMEQIKSVVG